MASSGYINSTPGSVDTPPKKPAPVPAVYIAKYNRFVDNILQKMNEILHRSYDPVNVKLQPIDASKKSSKPKKNKTKSNKRKTSSKKKSVAHKRTVDKSSTTSTEIPEPTTKAENITPLVEETVAYVENITEKIQNEVLVAESRALKDKSSAGESAKAKPTTTKIKGPSSTKTKPKPKPPTKTTAKQPAKNKKKAEKSKPRAKGTLYGLSSLRRDGDVAVNIMSDHTTVKSNFIVGPLTLKVEKEVKNGAKKELKSATATTAEMTGKLNLRINEQGVATLHSIKVLQPKQVRVDSNHERTRELVWQRSARIAHVVSQKLLSASKPMFSKQQTKTKF
ncbi:hypothetical protein EVAR_57343_1 [Eumeta japonica]|uniref:Uncharacterized protein n=1 Tax=Eumeta variegata TaxID=151549 RepID=A0A4C1Z6T9_EUMVA|nr:hypothetical protein EVAR_57343_1 [Eumeta japonica]